VKNLFVSYSLERLGRVLLDSFNGQFLSNEPLGDVRNLIALHCIVLWDLSPFASLRASSVRDNSVFRWT